MALDLNVVNLAEQSEEGFEFELIHPGTQEPLGAFIKVRGELSKVVKAAARKRFNEFQQRQKIAARKGKDDDLLTLDEAEELSVETAVTRIIGWRNIEEGGATVPFTVDNAERILTQHSWIKEQVMEASSELSNFC